MAVRKNIYSLSQAEIDNFVKVVKTLKANGVYDGLILAHNTVRSQVHATPMYLPWHRAFLNQFEEKMQAALGDPGFGIPYWDWTVDAALPNGIGRLWGASMMGNSTQPPAANHDGTPVNTGPFAGSAQWPTISPNNQFGNALQRNLGWGALRLPPASVTVDILTPNNKLGSKKPPYDLFRAELEGKIHNPTHSWVGGQMASVSNSVNDPVFFLHQANVDRIWAQWQLMYPEIDLSTLGTTPALYQSSGVTVASVLDDPFTLYRYDQFTPADAVWSQDALIADAANPLPVSQSPALAAYNGKLYCVRHGARDNGQLLCATFDGTNWSADQVISPPGTAVISCSPALAAFSGKLFCVYQGASRNGQVHFMVFDGTSWSQDQVIPNVGMSDSPALAVFNGKLYCAHQGWGDKGDLWYLTFDGKTWSSDTCVQNVGMSSSPALAVYNGKLYCVHHGWGNRGETWCTTFDGTSWSQDQRLGNLGLSSSPALAVYGGKLLCVRREIGDRSNTRCATFDGTNWSDDNPLPDAAAPYGVTNSPTLAVFNGKLYCARQGRDGSSVTMCATATI